MNSVACHGIFFPLERLASLRLLGPPGPRCLLCSLGSLRSRHALSSIGPTLLPSTRGAVFNNYKLGFGMNLAMFRHVGYVTVAKHKTARLAPSASGHHDFNLQAIECFANVVVTFLDDPGEVWPVNRTIRLGIPHLCQQLRRFLGNAVA